ACARDLRDRLSRTVADRGGRGADLPRDEAVRSRDSSRHDLAGAARTDRAGNGAGRSVGPAPRRGRPEPRGARLGPAEGMRMGTRIGLLRGRSLWQRLALLFAVILLPPTVM